MRNVEREDKNESTKLVLGQINHEMSEKVLVVVALDQNLTAKLGFT